MKHLLLIALLATPALGEGREVIMVKEGNRFSKFVYKDGVHQSETSWSRAGRCEGPGAGPWEGLASHYGGGDPFTGSKCATGETLADGGCTAAHRTLPLGTWVRVTNRLNGRSVVVRINDRGPFFRDRVIDLSNAAAKAIGIEERGLAPVTLHPVGGGKP